MIYHYYYNCYFKPFLEFWIYRTILAISPTPTSTSFIQSMLGTYQDNDLCRHDWLLLVGNSQRPTFCRLVQHPDFLPLSDFVAHNSSRSLSLEQKHMSLLDIYSVACHDLMNITDSRNTKIYHDIIMTMTETAFDANQSRLICLIRSVSTLIPDQICWTTRATRGGRKIFVCVCVLISWLKLSKT